MNKRTAIHTALCVVIAAIPVGHAGETTQGIHIARCSVYSEQDKSIKADCTRHARDLCTDLYYCELPIGRNLTDGKDIDNNEETWEMVKVDYLCAGKAQVNGPHYQNDHATMSLSCQR